MIQQLIAQPRTQAPHLPHLSAGGRSLGTRLESYHIWYCLMIEGFIPFPYNFVSELFSRVKAKMVNSLYKNSGFYHHFHGFRPLTIAKLLQEENMKASRWGAAKFLEQFCEDGTILRRVGSRRPSKVTADIMRENAIRR